MTQGIRDRVVVITGAAADLAKRQRVISPGTLAGLDGERLMDGCRPGR
jgi:hypothetical protein